MSWGEWSERLGAFLFPAACLGCGVSSGEYLCSACRSSFHPSHGLLLQAELRTLGSYEGVLAEAIGAVKHKGHKALGRELARLAALAVGRRWGSNERHSVYPLRASRSGQRYRGFSLPGMMEEAVLETTGWSALDGETARRFPDSAVSSHGLNLEQRLERQFPNRPFQTQENREAGPILLLDDVVTSGATMGAAVSRARELGFGPVRCFALALAPEA